MTASILVGNPKARSRTLEAAKIVVERLTGSPASSVVDLVEFGSGLLEWGDAAVAQTVDELAGADLLIVASPTYKGTFTGLLKLFLDRVGGGAWSGVTAIPLMLGGDWRHSLAPEVFLKPVLAELGASTPTRGLFLLDTDYADSEALTAWLELARRQLPPRLLERSE